MTPGPDDEPVLVPPTSARKAWQTVVKWADYLAFATMLGMAGSIVVGILFIAQGAATGEIGEGFRDSTTVVYQLRPTGVLLVALGLLLGPPAVAIELAAVALAKDRLGDS